MAIYSNWEMLNLNLETLLQIEGFRKSQFYFRVSKTLFPSANAPKVALQKTEVEEEECLKKI